MSHSVSERISSILVTGGSGTLGSEVVRRLTENGFRPRVLSRNPQKNGLPALRRAGAEITLGDLNKPATLIPALEGIRVVFLSSSDDPRQAELQGNLVAAAERAGVSRIVKVSAYVASLESSVKIGRWHAQTERQIEESGMAFTHLRPFYFMQNFLEFARTIASESAFYAPAGEGRIAMVDSRDVAIIAAKVLTEENHDGKVYEISGPEALSFGDAAAQLSAFLGKSVSYLDVSPNAALQAMKAAGIPGWYAWTLIELYELLKDGYEESVTPVLGEMGVVHPRTFADFVQDHGKAFRL